ncbi:MAG TPA: T9SS type A sorting domain-containing protein, partial [Flavitalea sp.]|nr:T9SS type A sorting domain-containing protein [Flavitalea sp.]
SKIVIAANDGGIQMTNNILATGGTEPVKWNMIRNYQTLQYYHVAIDPVATQMNFIGGAQDNGTQLRIDPSNFHTRIFSGDGGAAGIGVLNDNTYTLYGSSQLGDIYRYMPADFTNISPSGLTPFPGIQGYGEFITYFKLDQDNPEDIYYANFNRLFRTDKASTVNSSEWEELDGVGAAVNPSNPSSGTDIGIRALEVSRGPYRPSHALYMGTSDGQVFRLDDPRNAPLNSTPVDITPDQLKAFRNDGTGVNIADIAVNPNNDSEIMIVVSNYSVTSSSGVESNDFNIYWTNNAKTATPTWKKAEGTLTLPSIRSCMIINKKVGSVSTTEYYVGTSVGLYSAVNIGSTLQANGQVNWVREGGNILNFALVNTMDLRPSDNTLLVGTHGNGLFYGAIGNPDFHPDQPTGIDDPVRNDKNFIVQAAPTIVQNTINYTVGNMFSIRKITLAITNLNGQVILRKEAPYANGQLFMPPMPKGVYVLTIISDDNKQQYVKKVVKE